MNNIFSLQIVFICFFYYIHSARMEDKFESLERIIMSISPVNSHESVDNRSTFRSRLESAIRRTKAGYHVCNELSDLLSTFSASHLREFRRRGYFWWSPSPSPPLLLRKTALPVCTRGMHRPPANRTVFDRVFAISCRRRQRS